MKRLLAAFGILFLVLLTGSANAQNTQNFYFSDFHADYYLSKDEEGRSRLKVVDTITAEFPYYNQNKGLVRAIPKTYDGHSVSFNFQPPLRRNGVFEPIYDQYVDNNHEVIETGDDDYVLGSQTYEFTYTLRDVTKDFGDYQEFFWDVNGTEWQQKFEKVSATVYLDESVASDFVGEIRCFVGSAGSQNPCGVSLSDDHKAHFETTKTLPGGQTLSLVMKFEPNTFKPYTEGRAGLFRAIAAILAWVIAIITSMYALWVRFTRGRDAKGKGVIIPQYTPPEGISIWTLASLTKKMKKAMPAQIIDLAVRKKIRIIENEKKILFFTTKEYALELLDTNGLAAKEKMLVSILFGAGARLGATYKMKKRDKKRQKELYGLSQATKKALIKAGYRRKIKPALVAFIAPFVSGAIGFILIENMENAGVPADWRMTSVAGAFACLFVVLFTLTKKPLTDKGRELVDYAKGLEEYIKLAEADRIKFLQSPEGAQKILVNTDDKKQMVKLYEKLLPYAILFGQEKEWAKVLEMYYQETGITAPGWYAGAGVFTAGNFSSSIGSFTSSSSSSSGFSGGGGAGGGGGGGGGGGR